jgi:hypothetical protein
VLDLLANPRLAKSEQIVAVPSVVRRMPLPAKNIIGDLANEEKWWGLTYTRDRLIVMRSRLISL